MPKTAAKLMTTEEMMAVMEMAKDRIASDEHKIALLEHRLATARDQLQNVLDWFGDFHPEIGPAEEVLFERIENTLKATEEGTAA